MTGRSIARLADDPRAVTLGVVALVAAGLWIALWQAMSMPIESMNMGGMPPDGMSATRMTMDGASETAPMAGMPGLPDMPGKPTPPDWSAGLVASTMAMWLLMMAAMMLPAMAPMMAIYAGLAAKEDRGSTLALRIALFALGYFMLWGVFAAAAALGQLGLRDSAWLTLGGTTATPLAAGVLLLIAGAHQFTSVKDLCLRHCRHPLAYLMVHWREGLRGAFPVGARHGLYCFGCCVAFMGLMFVFGAMNVLWMAVIALYFLAEKVLPHERVWGRAVGAMLLAAGAAVLVREAI
jgi:predicted metal-binding membrane protein